MTSLRRFAALALLCTCAALGRATPLAAADRAFLAAYESIRAALADDDLSAAQSAAHALPAAKPIAEARDISTARKGFKALSAQAVALARGQPGYYIAHCTMFPGGADWVQTTEELANPYWGKSMPHCGQLVK